MLKWMLDGRGVLNFLAEGHIKKKRGGGLLVFMFGLLNMLKPVQM